MTEDGRRLRLADPHDPGGPEFTVEIDARLRAALGITPSSPTDRPVPSGEATVENQMDSMLRPRDIQARIRSGETPESVAAAAQTTVEKVMPYAAPVLAEREHVAERAQRSSIRRPAGEAPHGVRTLGEAITTHLHTRNIDPEVVGWDAWRREDGRWALTGRYSVQGREGLAELTFDQPGNFVVLDNDDARWLVGDLPDAVAEPEPEPGVRRLAAVPADDDQLALGDDVLGIAEELVGDDDADDGVDDAEGAREPFQTEQPLEAFLDDHQGTDEVTDEVAGEVHDDVTGEPIEDAEPDAPRRRVKKTRGRASVPSWDEIMFGGPSSGDNA